MAFMGKNDLLRDNLNLFCSVTLVSLSGKWNILLLGELKIANECSTEKNSVWIYGLNKKYISSSVNESDPTVAETLYHQEISIST